MYQKVKNLTVFVTRPDPHGLPLCKQIETVGFKTIYFPVIEIKPLSFVIEKNYDWLIFTSQQAVYHSHSFFSNLTATTKIAAIGKATALALENAGLTVEIYPEQEWNSEGLLALPKLQSVSGQKIAIIKGQGGRRLLYEQLILRGAEVDEIDVYQRILPNDTKQLVNPDQIDIIICTSNEGIENLKKQLTPIWKKLQEKTLLVISDRMRQFAQESGFKTIWLANNATNAAIVETLLNKVRAMENSNPSPPAKKGRLIKFVFILLILTGLIFGGYFASNYILKNNRTIKNLENAQQSNNKSLVAMQEQLNQLIEENKSQQQIINALRQTQSGFNRDEWRVMQAEFILRLANSKLQFENNSTEALKLLQLSDAELSQVNDPRLTVVRQSIANDITQLKAIPVVDMTGLYLRLAALNEQVDQLPLPNKPEINVNQAPVDTNLPWWKRGLYQTWEGLKQIVVIRYNKDSKLPLVSPEVHVFLYQNVHAALEKAMWGLLHQQPSIYLDGIKQAKNWISRYFVNDSPITQNMLTNLNQLEQINIHPNYPNLADSMEGFKNYFANKPQESSIISQ